MSELIGKTIGQYQIIEQIGKGGMATIFKAYQSSIDRYVAIKVLPKEFAEDPNFVKRFAHEAKAIAALEHPHILPVHDFGNEDGLSFMVMRYVTGGTLSDQMGSQMPYERITQIVGHVAKALNYAHSRGVVHRDIKPSNILIDEHGEVLLTDFGIAKIVEGSKATQLTADGSVLGTPAYMAPEQAQGGAIDGRTDIYSLGVVLYELLTGRPPYNAETPFAIVFKHVNEPLPPPRSIKPDIPEAFERVVLKAMAKDPNQRFETAGQMEQALQNALKEIEPADTPSPMASAASAATLHQTPQQTMAPQPAKRGPSAKPLVIGGIAVVLLLCLVGGAIVLFLALSSGGEGGVAQNQQSAASSVNIGDSSTESSDTGEAPAPSVSEDSSSKDAGNLDELDGTIAFEDDFSSNRNDWVLGEESDDFGKYTAQIEEGLYRVYLDAITEDGNFIWLDPTAPEFKNFKLTAEAVHVESDASSSYGIIFRATPEGDFYLFEVDQNGFSVSLNFADEDWIYLTEYTETSAINPAGPNTLTVVADGNNLTFIINGEEVAEIQDDTLDSGTFGLALSLFEKGELRVEFDNIVVFDLEEE